jgi:6-phosphofructokinase 1
MPRGRIGVLTGGGDTSALNATLKGIALVAEAAQQELVGIVAGWAGMLADGAAVRLPSSAIDENRGGTLIRTSRTNLRDIPDGIEQAAACISRLGLTGVIAIGGDDTLTVGVELANAHEGVPINFVTKTIDNDVGTNPPPTDPLDLGEMRNYFCPGFPTAATWLAQAAAALRTTAYSHDRVLILEAMGRTAGWLALSSAYGHPDFVITTELPFDVDAFAEKAAERYRRERNLVIVVAEGARDMQGRLLSESGERDAFGHVRLGGSSQWLAEALKERLARERGLLSASGISAVIASYLQRCGSPVAADRDMGLLLGRKAVEVLLRGKSGLVACPVLDGDVLRAAALSVDDVLPRDEEGTIIPRVVDGRLYDGENYCITESGAAYFERFLGRIPAPYRPPYLEPFPGM